MFVLDTDHLSLLHDRHPVLLSRIKAVAPADIAITIITFEELISAWYTQIRQSRDPAKLERAYQGLFETIEDVRYLNVFPFCRPAIDRFFDLRKTLRRVGRMDLAIASIVLEFNATLLTRNRQDFELIPGLRIEDWSVESK